MPRNQAALLKEALTLPETERAELADRLLESLEGPINREIEAAWASEAEDRVEAYRRGEISARPGDEVLAEIRQRFSG